MIKDNGLKKKIIQYFILSILFFAVSVLVNIYYGKSGSLSSYKQEEMAEVLRLKENKMKIILDKIVKEDKESITFPLIHRNLPPDLWQQDGMLIFVYLDDSLIYWSDYNAPALPEFPENLFDKPFIRYGNGWFRVITLEKENLNASGLILIKNDFPYQNEYLINDFRSEYGMPETVELDTIPGTAKYYAEDGQFLFSLLFPEKISPHSRTGILIFILSMSSFIFLILALFYLYQLFSFLKDKPILLLMAFSIDALLIRGLTIYFEIPRFIYNTDLFKPYLYSTSFFSPSLGDLVVNSVLWLILAWAAYKSVLQVPQTLNKWIRESIRVFTFLFTGILFYLLVSSISRLVFDSNLELNLNNIFNIDIFSLMGFFSVTCLILAFFLVTSRLICIVGCSGLRKWKYVTFSLIASLLMIPLFGFESSGKYYIIYAGFLFIYFLSFLYFSAKEKTFHNISGALVYIVVFSMVATFALDYSHGIREKSKRKNLASELASKRDPLMEFEFAGQRNEILQDSVIINMLKERKLNKDLDKEIVSYIDNEYFKAFRNKYETVVTICQQEDILKIQPGGYLTNCIVYFREFVDARGAEYISPGLYFLNYSAENNNYMAVFDYMPGPASETDTTRIFVELYYKYITETGLGYPDLLIDRKVQDVSELSGYSFARYVDDKLIYKFGDFSYHLGFDPYNLPDQNSYFIDNEGYSHYIIKSDNLNKLIISAKKPTFLDLVAPFSYLFIFFAFFLIIFLMLLMLPRGFRKLEFNFSNQLQLSVIAIIIVSFFVLGLITRLNIIHLYDNKNRDNLSEKTFSVLTELEHKIGDIAEIPDEMHGYLYELLYKFSLIFFSDINLYDLQGNLIASSRPQIFDEELISGKMHTEAFYKLAYDHSLLYIQDEKIGRQQYLSAYIPLRNNNDEIIAYVNLPYFAKQTELKKEIADFLATYINVYVLLIVLAMVVTIIVSRFVTRPLQLIREKLGNIGLGKTNEKIDWRRKDEIGRLVDEYNRMIDELTRSAEKLASSERESAWREMARQVAHEIKNPLTPMKLSVQYLQKAWEEKSPDWEARLERFTRTVVEQIDSLSEIASEFSDFAKMPVANLQKIELTEIVNASTDLYHHLKNVQLNVDFEGENLFVLADRRQLLRVFNNLIQNAVQAIGQKENGIVRISIRRMEQHYMVEITDNGTGITDEQAKKIFSPSFTTKSSGTGLGLAIVKNIMKALGGSVDFKSTASVGTTFSLKIPIYPEDKIISSA